MDATRCSCIRIKCWEFTAKIQICNRLGMRTLVESAWHTHKHSHTHTTAVSLVSFNGGGGDKTNVYIFTEDSSDSIYVMCWIENKENFNSKDISSEIHLCSISGGNWQRASLIPVIRGAVQVSSGQNMYGLYLQRDTLTLASSDQREWASVCIFALLGVSFSIGNKLQTGDTAHQKISSTRSGRMDFS